MSLEQKIDRIIDALYGPTGEPEKGLLVRVDRLERDHWKWFLGAMLPFIFKWKWIITVLMSVIITVLITYAAF